MEILYTFFGPLIKSCQCQQRNASCFSRIMTRLSKVACTSTMPARGRNHYLMPLLNLLTMPCRQLQTMLGSGKYTFD
uniref:Uncharacterized protein n=1 Tax=Anguilla anguilla TaxID=7936 RepID=A0A0E9WVL4_ANGAN